MMSGIRQQLSGMLVARAKGKAKLATSKVPSLHVRSFQTSLETTWRPMEARRNATLPLMPRQPCAHSRIIVSHEAHSHLTRIGLRLYFSRQALVNARIEGAATTRHARTFENLQYLDSRLTRQENSPQHPVVAQTSATLPGHQQDADLDANASADCSFQVHCDAVRSLSTPDCSRRGPVKLSLSSRASDDRTPREHPIPPPDQRPLRPPKGFQALPSNHDRITSHPKKDVPDALQHTTRVLEICLPAQMGWAAQTS
jgi:hypothetical protein